MRPNRTARVRAAAGAVVVCLVAASGALATPKPGVVWIPAASTNLDTTRARIDLIVIHKAEGSAQSAASAFQNPARRASAHYSVGDSVVYQMVDERFTAWHCGNYPYNQRSIGIENGGFTYANDFTEAHYRLLAQLVANICERYGIPEDRAHIIGHSEVPDPNHPGLFGGVDHHTDPGPYFDWAHFMDLVHGSSGRGARVAPPGSGVALASTPDGRGYWIAKNDGGVFSYGDARFFGSAASYRLTAPIVGIAATPDGGGYWLVSADGGVFAFGDARFFGSLGGMRLNAPIVGIAAAPGGDGYLLVAADGGVFAFGGAHYLGGVAGLPLAAPVVGVATTPSGGGYWLVAADGGLFAFGDARFFGSLGALRLNAPIVGMARTPSGRGYLMVASDGGVFCFGDAAFEGSTGNLRLNAPVAAIVKDPISAGYWLVAWDGGIFAFGGAGFFGAGV